MFKNILTKLMAGAMGIMIMPEESIRACQRGSAM